MKREKKQNSNLDKNVNIEKTIINAKKHIVVTLFVQFILSVITLVFLIIYFFNKNFMSALQISLGLTMLITGYNNYYVYKRKLLTLVYFVLGLLLLALAVITIIGI
ncbi:MAG: hypothetical protein IKO49_03455 [Bacilli bacterium]|nr:hypothetical protein [Bacilli bacterium]